MGPCFGKVSVLAIMSSKIYPGKLEWTLNADRLKFNGRFAKPNISFIGPAIVAFVRRKLDNFRKTRKLQLIQTHKTSSQKSSWHTGDKPSVFTCGPTFEAQHWHLSLSLCNAGVKTSIMLLSATF